MQNAVEGYVNRVINEMRIPLRSSEIDFERSLYYGDIRK